MQFTTDDLSHDVALLNRVAALDLLDLGLGHLGIEIEEAINEELDLVVNAYGESEFFSTVTLIAYLTLFTPILKCWRVWMPVKAWETRQQF